MLERAKTYFDTHPCGGASNGTYVIGGWLSPSHDEYVSRKLGKEWIPGVERCALVDAATADSALWSSSSWETRAPGFRNFPLVSNAHQSHLDEFLPAPVAAITRVVFVGGSDLLGGFG